MLASLFMTKLLPEPAYEAYVAAAGIDGSSDFHIDEMYGCPKPPCPGGWDFPSSKGAPASVFGFGQMVSSNTTTLTLTSCFLLLLSCTYSHTCTIPSLSSACVSNVTLNPLAYDLHWARYRPLGHRSKRTPTGTTQIHLCGMAFSPAHEQPERHSVSEITQENVNMYI